MNIINAILGKIINRYSSNMFYHADGSRTGYSSRYDRIEHFPSYNRRVCIPIYYVSTDKVYAELADLEKLNWEEKGDRKFFSVIWVRGGQLTKDDTINLAAKLSEYIEWRGRFSLPEIILH